MFSCSTRSHELICHLTSIGIVSLTTAYFSQTLKVGQAYSRPLVLEAVFFSQQAVNDYRVTKVREFQRVAKLCDADGHMQQKLKQLLKLSKEKWDAACEHAKTAVQVHTQILCCQPSGTLNPKRK